MDGSPTINTSCPYPCLCLYPCPHVNTCARALSYVHAILQSTPLRSTTNTIHMLETFSNICCDMMAPSLLITVVTHCKARKVSNLVSWLTVTRPVWRFVWIFFILANSIQIMGVVMNSYWPNNHSGDYRPFRNILNILNYLDHEFRTGSVLRTNR